MLVPCTDVCSISCMHFNCLLGFQKKNIATSKPAAEGDSVITLQQAASPRSDGAQLEPNGTTTNGATSNDTATSVVVPEADSAGLPLSPPSAGGKGGTENARANADKAYTDDTLQGQIPVHVC